MILVVGATGKLGSTITRMLLAQSQPVHILARSQSNYQPLADARAQVVLGDLKERSSLGAACEGADIVITTASAGERSGEVAIYEHVLGRPIPVRSVAPGEPVPGLPEIVAQLLAGLDTFDSPIDITETARTFGIQLTTLEEVARRTAGSTVSASS
jgi:uncharacterized protein YbjT (DUF2867 family)